MTEFRKLHHLSTFGYDLMYEYRIMSLSKPPKSSTAAVLGYLYISKTLGKPCDRYPIRIDIFNGCINPPPEKIQGP